MCSSSACPRTYESAICADSFITSPSCPVSVSPGLPGIAVASTNSTSPPAPVTARPVATPGTAVRIADSWKNFTAQRVAHRLEVDHDWPGCFGRTGVGRLAGGGEAHDRSGRDLRGCLAQQRPDLPLEVADSRLARVLRHDRLQQLVADVDLVRPQSVAVELSRPQVTTRDRDLFGGRVTVEADDLHAVEQRTRDRVGHIRRRDEHHAAEINLHVQVVVPEAVVLRRVEDLEQSGAQVTAPVGTDLVDL